MDHHILSLTCPNCGNTENNLDVNFGYEFTCRSCGSVSVLIINNQLYFPQPGEKVCATCGRVADRNARFCQCGKTLIRKCISPSCLREFPVHHHICDFCGWPQNTPHNSCAGMQIRLKRALDAQNDPDWNVASGSLISVEQILTECQDETIFKELLKSLDLQNPDHLAIVKNIYKTTDPIEIQKRKELLKSLDLQNPDHLAIVKNIYITTDPIEIQKRKELVEYITLRGPSSIPFLVELMDDKWSCSLSEDVYQAIVKIGRSGVPEIKTALNSQNISMYTRNKLQRAMLEASINE